MKFTPQRVSPELRPRRPAFSGRPAFVFLLSGLAAVLVAPGCTGPTGRVLPAFLERHVGTIRVEKPVNETVVPLDELAFGGPLQKLTFGPHRVNVLALLEENLIASLAQKGYTVAPAGGGSGTGERADAVLKVRVTEARADTTPPYAFFVRFRIEIIDPESGAVLYEAEDAARAGGRTRTPFTREFVERPLARAVERALSALPERT